MYMIWIWGTEKESLYYFPKHIATGIQFLSCDHTINSIIKKVMLKYNYIIIYLKFASTNLLLHLHTFSISSINIMNLPESLKLKRRSFVLFLTCQNIDSIYIISQRMDLYLNFPR